MNHRGTEAQRLRRTDPRFFVVLSLGLCVWVVQFCLVARAEPPNVCEAQTEEGLLPVIVGGQVTNEFPSVGLFKNKIADKPATATLIGQRTVLTAAHCIDDDFKHTIVLDGKEYEMESAVRHPEFVVNNGDLTRMDPFDRAEHDIAVVRLKEAPPITPATINRLRIVSRQPITVVGFGETELNRGDRGTKRRANNFVERTRETKFEFNGLPSVCHGDSGGPTFIVVRGQVLLAGVHSVVSNPCGRFGVDTRVDAYWAWIVKEAQNDVFVGPLTVER